MENTIAYFGLKDEDDYMYKKGVAATQTQIEQTQQQFEQKQRFAVIKFLDMGILSDSQIANGLELSFDFVQSVKKDLSAAAKKMERLKAKKSAIQIAQLLNLPINWVEKQLAVKATA